MIWASHRPSDCGWGLAGLKGSKPEAEESAGGHASSQENKVMTPYPEAVSAERDQ